MMTIEEIKTLRTKGRNKWGLALLNFIKPFRAENYSYVQISDLLNEKYNFEIKSNALKVLANYYKDYASVSQQIATEPNEKGREMNSNESKEKIALSQDDRLGENERNLLNFADDDNSLSDFKKEIKSRITW